MDVEDQDIQIDSENQEHSKMDRLKGFMGLFLHLGAPSMSIFYFVFQIYKLMKKSVGSFFQVLILTSYMFLFAKKNKTYIKLLERFDPTKFFKKWEIVCEEEPDKYGVLFPYHPHSIFCFGIQFNINKYDSPFNGAVALASREALSIPPASIVYRWWGIQGVNAQNFEDLMMRGKNICFVPGGFEEATLTSHKEYRLYLKKRMGFIKYALVYGYKICPVFVFNENKMYKTTDFMLKQRMWLNNLKIPSTIFWSQYGPIPDPNVEIVTVVGKAIQLPQICNPSRQIIERYHEIYIHRVKELFYNHVEKYDPGAELVIYGEDILPHKPKL